MNPFLSDIPAWPKRRSAHLLSTFVIGFASIACQATTGFESNQVDPLAPRLFYVGTDSVLTFTKGRELRIPVSGYRLMAAKVTVIVEGAVPAVPLDDYEYKPGDDWNGTVLLKSPYVDELDDMDPISVTVYATPSPPVPPVQNAEESGLRKQIASVTRHFTLRETQKYRDEVVVTMAPFNDVRAFPMSSEIVEEVFGHAIDDNYYVIAIRVYNRTPHDRVITAGMITAHGRLVALGPGGIDQPILAMPVQISPVQTTLAYANVDARRDYTTRNWVFRSLAFGGALATGSAAAFEFNDTWTSAVSLFTGIFIPQGQKLWPDPTSGHLANIVTFGMPDTVKVAAGASAGGVLFFAKRELHSMVGQAEYLNLGASGGLNPDLKVEQPPQFIAGLEVNSINVQFENTISPQDLNRLEARAQALGPGAPVRAAQQLNALRGDLDLVWNEAGFQAIDAAFGAADAIDQLVLKDPALAGSTPLALTPDEYWLHPDGLLRKELNASRDRWRAQRTELRSTYDDAVASLGASQRAITDEMAAGTAAAPTADTLLRKAAVELDEIRDHRLAEDQLFLSDRAGRAKDLFARIRRGYHELAAELAERLVDDAARKTLTQNAAKFDR
mgnify:CR=1 FL=1